jgi:hypothetical protein
VRCRRLSPEAPRQRRIDAIARCLKGLACRSSPLRKHYSAGRSINRGGEAVGRVNQPVSRARKRPIAK